MLHFPSYSDALEKFWGQYNSFFEWPKYAIEWNSQIVDHHIFFETYIFDILCSFHVTEPQY